VIFDIVEYILMEWTIPNESRICRICMRVLICLSNLKERRRMLLASLPQSSIGQKRSAGITKLNREDYGVDKYFWYLCFFSRLTFGISRRRLRFLAG
jgi:hypothetical protein